MFLGGKNSIFQKPEYELFGLALVTTYGLTQNSYSGQFHSAITMDALFEKEA